MDGLDDIEAYLEGLDEAAVDGEEVIEVVEVRRYRVAAHSELVIEFSEK